MSGWETNSTSGTAPSKRALIGGNWKCNGKASEIAAMIDVLNASGKFPVESEVVIAVPSIHLLTARDSFRDDINVAAQDVGIHGMGAYTGELSAEMLTDSGISWTLAGHSERRAGFGYAGEPSEVVATKAKRALDQGMNVIICVGEKLEDRDADRTMEVLRSMLEPCFAALVEEDWARCVLAYEPVWAIGTGKVATPEQAEGTHAELRALVADKVSPEVASALRIIYGGSAKKANCGALIKCKNIDGFLVGGASLKPEFSDMIKCTPGNI